MGRTLTLLGALVLLPVATLAACASRTDHPPVLDECGAAACGSAAGSGGTSSGDTDGSSGGTAGDAGTPGDDASTGIDAGLGLVDGGFGGGLFD